MTSEAAISLIEVKKLANAIFDRLIEEGIDAVPVKGDEFWQVFFTEAFDMSNTPEATVGTVSDCIADLRQEANSDEMIGWHALQHLSGILAFLAHAANGGFKISR